MKQLLIVRHAKSNWDFSILNDIDRVLNERGHKDAPIMAQRILSKGIKIDAFVTSNAKRAFATSAYFANVYNQPESSIIEHPELYHASSDSMFKIVSNFNNRFNCVAMFSHNPGITDFVNELTDIKIDNVPTCAVFAIKINCDSWKTFKEAKKEFLFFDFPKNI